MYGMEGAANCTGRIEQLKGKHFLDISRRGRRILGFPEWGFFRNFSFFVGIWGTKCFGLRGDVRRLAGDRNILAV